jgi:serine/threonine protein kinase
MKFGQYELLERVAVGGMAEVFRGRVVGAEGFEKWVAIKRILPEFARDDRFISMLLSEARIHSALSHRNIVQIHDLGTSEDGEYFIVLEYVEGHDLRAVIEAATALGVQIPDSIALHIADELAQALHFAHELRDSDGQPLGIIHRDVSPSNVLISNSGEVKLSDFGIAKRRRENSVVGSLKGNLVYMSPEQARRAPLDRRTDVFSLGAVLFEMLVGTKIREMTDEVNGFRQASSGVVRSARELRPDIPPAYEALLARALEADPARRFPDAASFGAAIRELQRGSDSPVGPADLQELIELLNPPRRARSPVDLSRVIRLGPEFRLNPAAETPPVRRDSEPHVVLAPATTRGLAARLRATAGSQAAPASANGASEARAPGNGAGPRNGRTTLHGPGTPALTPPVPSAAAPPTAPLPTPVARAPRAPFRTGSGGAGLARSSSPPPPPGRRTTPPPSDGSTPMPAPSGFATARALSALNAVGETPAPSARAPAASSASPSGPTSTMFSEDVEMTPPPGGGVSGQAGAAGAVPEEAATPPPRSGAHPLTGWAAPPTVLPPTRAPRAAVGVPATALSPALAHEDFGGRMNAYPPAFADAAPTSEILRDAPTKAGFGRRASWVVLALALVAAGGAVVHFKVVPLEVLAVWMRPAQLSLDSDPPGASVSLDGRELSGITPFTVEVRRDRTPHLLEFRRAGSMPGQTTVRFDRTVPLAASVTLEAEPPLPPPAEPPVAAVASPPPVEAAIPTAPPPETAAPSASADGQIARHTKISKKGSKLARLKAAKAARRSKLARSKVDRSTKARSKSRRSGKGAAHGAESSGELF